ncbi:MAG: glycosyltransferase 87 family protein [Candidatus Binatia bacterium]
MKIAALRDWWVRHHTTLLSIAIVLMTLAAFHRLADQFSRLLWELGPEGAIDLKQRHQEVHLWFAGHSVYTAVGHAVYPPASYVILWPLLGWLSVTAARWLWAVTSVVMLGWLVYLAVRESEAGMRLEQLVIGLLALSMYATSATIGNGQLIVHILPMLITGITRLDRREGWLPDVLGAALIVTALVSPTIAAPFFWIVLFTPGRIRPAVLVVAGYVMLTLFAVWFQEASPVSVQEWAERGQKGAAWGAVQGGYANLHSWLGAWGLQAWNRHASLFVLSILGVWVYRHRRVDLWLLLGVSAIAARVWAYHRLYDDLLILLPLIALFRIAKRGPAAKGEDVIAGLLLAITWVAVLAPARLLVSPPLWSWLFAAGQTVVWVAMLIFLLWQASREKFARAAGVYSPENTVS